MFYLPHLLFLLFDKHFIVGTQHFLLYFIGVVVSEMVLARCISVLNYTGWDKQGDNVHMGLLSVGYRTD